MRQCVAYLMRVLQQSVGTRGATGGERSSTRLGRRCHAAYVHHLLHIPNLVGIANTCIHCPIPYPSRWDEVGLQSVAAVRHMKDVSETKEEDRENSNKEQHALSSSVQGNVP